MGILTNTPGVGYVNVEDTTLDRQLREGDGLGWSGDADLWLGYGVIVAPHRIQSPNGTWYDKGEVMARRYEVWRSCEDGQDRIIAHWRMEERERILYDLARMRAEAPGHVSVEDSIDRGNAAVDAANSQQFRDAYGEMLSHASALAHDRNNPKNVFRGMPGRRDL